MKTIEVHTDADLMDTVVASPALSASLEYLKYCAGKHLPSQFMEAELDYFGAHSYDLKSEGDGEVKKGTWEERQRVWARS